MSYWDPETLAEREEERERKRKSLIRPGLDWEGADRASRAIELFERVRLVAALGDEGYFSEMYGVNDEEIILELNRIIVSDPPTSPQDAIPKLVNLIQQLEKTQNPHPKQVKLQTEIIEKLSERMKYPDWRRWGELGYDALDFVERLKKNQANETELTQANETELTQAILKKYRIDFIIKAAKAIKDSAVRQINDDSKAELDKMEAQAQSDGMRSILVPNGNGSFSRYSVPIDRFGPYTPPNQNLQPPPSDLGADCFFGACGASAQGGHRSRSNIRRSYNRSINKSVGKKRKRFISRKY
jgi:hypothetical protein